MVSLSEMAERFYGFGRWEADYWFLGPEQGMAKQRDGLELRCECWDKFGCHELVDCIAYHQCLGLTRFHERPYPLQPTWQRLIRLLLAFKGGLPIQSAIRNYQGERWGITAAEGETCVIELSALAAPNLATERDRVTFRAHRIAVLRYRIKQHKPKFVVTYGLECKADFEQVAGGAFDPDGFCKSGSTVVMLVPAPTAFGYTNDNWVSYGRKLRERCGRMTN